MASKYSRLTASAQITAQPGTVEKVIIGTHNGSSFSLWDGDADGVGTRIIGTYFPRSGASEILVEVRFETALYMTVAPGAGNSIVGTVTFNGDPLR